jgi:cytochrome c peroxidase
MVFFKRSITILFALLLVLAFKRCEKDPPVPGKVPGSYDPTPYEVDLPQHFEDELPPMPVPEDNPLTEEGVELGKQLFFDPILSADKSLSCAGCHKPEASFSDRGNAVSTGIDGQQGHRNTMPLFNLAWQDRFNWHGSASSLEEQVFEPVRNPKEMAASWPNVTDRLEEHSKYPRLFYEAFGVTDIDSTHVAKAIAQYERTLISGNSKFDRYLQGKTSLSPKEAAGLNVFMSESKGDCFHCHGDPSNPLWTDGQFHNNGLDATFTDIGLEEVTGNPDHRGLFKTPSLRNLAFTDPYMHDGRFETLDAVIDHYSEGLTNSPTIDPLMKKVDQGGVQLSPQEKDQLKAFLMSLNDSSFVEREMERAPEGI